MIKIDKKDGITLNCNRCHKKFTDEDDFNIRVLFWFTLKDRAQSSSDNFDLCQKCFKDFMTFADQEKALRELKK